MGFRSEGFENPCLTRTYCAAIDPRPREAHLSAPQRQSQTYAWFPGPHGHAARTKHPLGAAQARPQAVDGQHRAQMKPEGLPRPFRLAKRSEFLRAQTGGAKHHMRYFLVFVAATASGDARRPTRLGITVTRKVGGAVVRNRIKRYVREAFRRMRRLFRQGLDLVWIAKRNAAEAEYHHVVMDMVALARRPGVGAET